MVVMGFLLNARTENALPVLNRRRLAIFSVTGFTLAVIAVVLAIIDPVTLLSRYNARLAPGTAIHKLLQTKIHGVHVQAYMFNITNSDRFIKGLDDKLKVEEVGPFTYKENRENLDMEFDENEGVLRYTPAVTVDFVPEESIGDPKNVNVTMPNIAFLSMTSMLSSYSPWAQIPFTMLTRKLDSKPVVTMDGHNYLWGYNEPLITFGNTVMPGWINFEKLGILDRLYDKKNTYRLEVGSTEKDKFRIKTLNGLKGIKALHWDDPIQRTKCNSFIDAYEGIAYPPGVTAETKIRIFRNVLCRFLELDFVAHRFLDYGAEGLEFTISNRTYNYNPDKMCLCKTGACYNGISDISACFFGLPLAISNAHFLGGEPRLFRKLEGLQPDEKKHGSRFTIEPKIGMVLGTSFTVQVNIVVKDVNFNSEVARFSDMVVPIAYFKIVQPDMLPHQIHDLRLMYIHGPRIFLAVEILFFLLGISLMGYTIRQIMWNATASSRRMHFPLSSSEKETQIKTYELPLIHDDS